MSKFILLPEGSGNWHLGADAIDSYNISMSEGYYDRVSFGLNYKYDGPYGPLPPSVSDRVWIPKLDSEFLYPEYLEDRLERPNIQMQVVTFKPEEINYIEVTGTDSYIIHMASKSTMSFTYQPFKDYIEKHLI